MTFFLCSSCLYTFELRVLFWTHRLLEPACYHASYEKVPNPA